MFFFCSQALGRMLDARQLGLKLIANVTFGYTSAHFSGRMPCVEVRRRKEKKTEKEIMITLTERTNAD